VTTIDIPSFDLSSFYFGQILDALIEYKRQHVPEHTDESDYDPYMQFLKMQALVGHINNCLIDLVANEATLPTAMLAESVRNHLRLIDYELATASPAQVDVLYELSKVFTAAFEVVPEGALVSTERQAGIDPVIFERLAAITIDPTDEFSHVFGLEGVAYTDYTTKANSQTTPADDWTPWTGAVDMKDAIYFGHKHIMWDKLGLWFTTPMAGVKAVGNLQCVAKANFIDGEKFALGDGVNFAVTFHFDVTGTYTPPGGYDATNIRVDISGDVTADQVATTAKAAINGVGADLLITGGVIVAGLLDLVNDMFGPQGNQAITETVADAGFTVAGMAGGTDGIVGVWEYYDGDFRKTTPSGVQADVPVAGKLLFDLTDYLGAANRQGTQIRARLNETTAYADVESAFGIPAGSGWGASRNYVVVDSYLGQTVPSTDAAAYTVGSDWEELPDLTDGTLGLSQDGNVEFTLPQTLTRDWVVGQVDGATAYWIRYRVISVTGVVDLPTPQYGRLDQGNQCVVGSSTQGQTQHDSPLSSSDGTAGQRFETTRDNYISGTMEVAIDGEGWTRVDDFLSSLPTDKHFVVEVGEDDRATIVMGDGILGHIPPAGVDNVSAEFRYGADLDGNVGAATIVIDKTSLTYIDRITNPRPAAGWTVAQGATEASLEAAKVAGPASLRVGRTPLGPDDVVVAALAFTDEAGAKPFSRAKAFEEGFGPKTVELVLVAAGGAQASASQLAALDEHFNGDPYSHPPKEKHFIANQQITSVNYTPKTIDIIATVYGDVTEAAIEARLAAVIQPEVKKEDGVTYEWGFGATVPTSRISHEIFEADEDLTKVVLVAPAADVPLSGRELPAIGTVAITVIS
jgi:hypothetical protein